MGTTLNKSAFIGSINEDIVWLHHNTKDCLERREIIKILQDSIQHYYPEQEMVRADLVAGLAKAAKVLLDNYREIMIEFGCDDENIDDYAPVVLPSDLKNLKQALAAIEEISNG
jgi:hypothetical protein